MEQGYLEVVKSEHPEIDMHIASLDTKSEVITSADHHDVTVAPAQLAPIVSDKMKEL